MIPSLLGSELVEVLGRMGCKVRHRGRGIAVVERRTDVLFVPEASTLSRHLVAAMLRTLAIEPETLLDFFSPDVDPRLPPSSSP
ncbi:MAG TPA: hypothetical protein VIF62_31285 [Labilithrix sp.]|jgi:hypothetical protein